MGLSGGAGEFGSYGIGHSPPNLYVVFIICESYHAILVPYTIKVTVGGINETDRNNCSIDDVFVFDAIRL